MPPGCVNPAPIHDASQWPCTIADDDFLDSTGVRNPFNPAENLRAGVAYLRTLLDRYQNNVELALAAYNAGPAAVDRHHQTVPPFRETQNYVSRITGMTGTVQTRGKQIYKTMVMVDGQPVSHYSDQKPASGPYELVGR